MEQIFRTLLNMSYTGSIVILAVLLIRALLKAAKAPAWIAYALWGAALFRLLCPFSFSSALALLPGTAPIPQEFLTSEAPEVHTGFAALNSYVNPAISGGLAPASPGGSASPAQVLFFIGGVVWLAGAAAVLFGGAVSACKFGRNLRFALRAADGVYESGNLSTAFVWGIFRPRVYMPAGLSGQSRAYILLHEKTHIRRLDHIGKLLFFLAAAAHWFNPLAWLAFRLFEKDMELSCDESVLSRAEGDIRKPYSETLLAVSARRAGGLSPISFGEGSVKPRIKHALNYKKPAFWLAAGAVVIALAAAVALVLDPQEMNTLQPGIYARRPYQYDAQKDAAAGQVDVYDYRVDGSYKSVLFYTQHYRRGLGGSLDISGEVADYAVLPILEQSGKLSVIIEPRENFSRGTPRLYVGLSRTVDTSSLDGYTALAVPRLDAYLKCVTAFTTPADDGGSGGGASGSLPIQPEQPVLLFYHAAMEGTGVPHYSCAELAGHIGEYDYLCLLWCVFSQKDAATLEAEFSAAPPEYPGSEKREDTPVDPGKLAEQRIDFLEGGKVVSSVPLEGNEAAIEAVHGTLMRHLLTSAAWPALDMENYPDRIDIRVRFSTLFTDEGDAAKDDTLYVYHIFVKDGRPCFQPGTGMWSGISEEDYEAILALGDGK